MPDICGWIGGAPGDEPEAVLARMRAGLKNGCGVVPAATHTYTSGLSVQARHPGALFAGEDGVLVAVEGRPYGATEAFNSAICERGPAAAVHAVYTTDGEMVLEKLCGAFALAVLDTRREHALLAIDRIGVHALVFSETPRGLVFGTSADAVRGHPGVAASVSPQGVYRYFVNAVSPAPHTIYDTCRKLLPAHALIWRPNSEVREWRYWRIPYAGQHDGRSTDALRAELFDHLRASIGRVRAYRHGGARHGTFLSGGLDSSTVSGLVQEGEATPVPAFTIGFDDPTFDETTYARIAAEHFGLAHHTYSLTAHDVAGLVPHLAAIFDEPFGNSSVIPAYYCAKLAKDRGVDFLFAGDGGDEIFAGNARYVEQKALGLYHRVPAAVRAPITGVLERIPERLAVSLLGKGQRYVRKARPPMPERMLGKTGYDPEQLCRIFTDEAFAALVPDEPFELWRQHYADSGTDDLVQSMLHLDMRITLADDDLRKVGRACELAGVEVAYPMLDDAVVAFAASIPSRILIKNFKLRHFYKEAMRGFLPSAILDKPKHGFGMPFADWTRADPKLWEMVADSFAGLKRRAVFRPEFLDEILATHRRSPDPSVGGVVWDLFMLESWWAHREP